MRYGAFLFIMVLITGLLPAFGSAEQWGCCVPPAGECFDGRAFTGQSEFQAACTDADGQLRGAGTFSTCDPYTRGTPETAVCEIGCCCAGPEVFNSPAINSDEDGLRSTRAACSGSGYEFRSRAAGQTCVQVCGGAASGPQPTGTHTIRGVVKNATGGNPLAGASVYVPIPGGQVSATADAQGRYTLSVPAMTARVFATHAQCRPGQTAPLVMNRDLDVNISLDCTRQACQHSAPAITQPRMNPGTSDVAFTISLEDKCSDFVQFEPLRCDAQFEGCQPLPPSASPAIIDRVPAAAGETVCYLVRARFAGGAITESQKSTASCVTTGDEVCMTRPATAPSAWCGTAGTPAKSSILRCNDQNKLEATPCTGTSVCSARGGTPTCVPPPPCDRCNGLLGLFASPDFRLSPDAQREISCAQAKLEGLCFEDRALDGRPVMVDAYAACLEVDDCAAYRNQDSCEQNVCGVEGKRDACKWTSVNRELGIGVCTSKAQPACERCEDLLGYCDRDVCHSISAQCYYDGEKNGRSQTLGCIAREDAACRYYDTREDCIGSGTNAQYNIQLDPRTKARIGGDNARTASSRDLLGFGACTWLAEESRCIKDADRNLSVQKEDDCFENGRYMTDPACYVDSTPPNTTIFLVNPPVYARSALQTLPVRVTDDRSPLDGISTYICLQQGAQPCYPNMTLSALPALPPAGTYKLRYYSIDANGNSETIKETSIILQDTENAALERVRIEENR